MKYDIYIGVILVAVILFFLSSKYVYLKRSEAVSLLRSHGCNLVLTINTISGKYSNVWPNDTNRNASCSVEYFSELLSDVQNKYEVDKKVTFAQLVDGWYLKPGKSNQFDTKNVIWTIAKNVTDNTPNNIPVLMTRNIDPSSLSRVVGQQDMEKTVRLDPQYQTMLDRSVVVVVFNDGYVKMLNLADNDKITYRSIYREQTVCNEDLKYLTPTREVKVE